MTSFDDRQEVYAEWRASQADLRLQRLLARRPAAFAAPGELHRDVAAWAATPESSGNLVLTGPVGVGKTWHLWKVAETLTRAGMLGDIAILGAYDFKRLITPPVDEAALSRLVEADLLELDDLGAIRVSDWDLDHLYGLIDRRWQHNRPTVVASNQLDLRGVLGERTASRIAHGATVVELTGADRRRPS